MTAPAPASAPPQGRADGHLVRRIAHAVLVLAVRGRRERGGPWGEAVLGEFHRTRGSWESVRWAAGGLRAVWQERRNRVRELPRFQRIARGVVGTTIVALVAGLFVNQFVLTSRYEPSGAMEPTLLIGDRFLVDRVGYRLTGIRHGDVVDFRIATDAGDRNVAKRVIGLAGDTIECRDGRVLRNGAVLDEPYLSADAEHSRTDCTPLTVPPGAMYVLGDHRDVSRDSRHLGAIPLDAVDGRMLVRYWPIPR